MLAVVATLCGVVTLAAIIGLMHLADMVAGPKKQPRRSKGKVRRGRLRCPCPFLSDQPPMPIIATAGRGDMIARPA